MKYSPKSKQQKTLFYENDRKNINLENLTYEITFNMLKLEVARPGTMKHLKHLCHFLPPSCFWLKIHIFYIEKHCKKLFKWGQTECEVKIENFSRSVSKKHLNKINLKKLKFPLLKGKIL